MKTNGINELMSGCIAFQQDDTALIGLAEALEYLEWLEFQSILWGYNNTPTNSPNKERIH